MRIADGLYHKDIILPPLKLMDAYLELNYTLHAIKSAENDRYEEINLPSAINFAMVEVIEIEILDDDVEKMIVRQKYSKEYDLILVIMPRYMKVKTVWLNEVEDTHKTLNQSKYRKTL